MVEKGGNFFDVSFGDVITDEDWGAKYFLDPEKVPRSFQKRFFIEEAKRKLEDFLDLQLFEETKQTNWRLAKIMGSIMENKDKPIEKRESGHVAEKMVENIFKKVILDLNLDLEATRADISQDAELAIDFIIHRKKHFRGIGIEGSNDKGIQFTISRNKSILHRKRSRLKEVRPRLEEEGGIDDIYLVSVPMTDMKEVYQKWELAGKPPGGPDKFLDPEVKKILFKKLLERIYSEEEIENIIKKI